MVLKSAVVSDSLASGSPSFIHHRHSQRTPSTFSNPSLLPTPTPEPKTPKLRNPPRVYTIQYLEARTRAPSAPPLPAFHHPLPGSCTLRDEPPSPDACHHSTNRHCEPTWPTRKSLMPSSTTATQAPGRPALRLPGSQAPPNPEARLLHPAGAGGA
ncbi:hypothetical protein IQ07DRAFT_306078 [Pyrenochaeta sp. DS3sAY3a]|nr:hypothetical protein IQ07DRAFT_306078 [Pyrenochaeta sp. DS3sAY3a]